MGFVKYLTVVGSIVLDNTYLVKKFYVCVFIRAVILAMEGISEFALYYSSLSLRMPQIVLFLIVQTPLLLHSFPLFSFSDMLYSLSLSVPPSATLSPSMIFEN